MIGVNEEVLSPEIVVGSLVVFRSPDDPKFARNKDDREWQETRFKTHRRPLKVRVRLGDHVVLVHRDAQVDPNDPGKHDIHFGSTCDPRLHVGHVRLYP